MTKRYTIGDAIATHTAHKWGFTVRYESDRIVLISEVGGTFLYSAEGILMEDEWVEEGWED